MSKSWPKAGSAALAAGVLAFSPLPAVAALNLEGGPWGYCRTKVMVGRSEAHFMSAVFPRPAGQSRAQISAFLLEDGRLPPEVRGNPHRSATCLFFDTRTEGEAALASDKDHIMRLSGSLGLPVMEIRPWGVPWAAGQAAEVQRGAAPRGTGIVVQSAAAASAPRPPAERLARQIAEARHTDAELRRRRDEAWRQKLTTEAASVVEAARISRQKRRAQWTPGPASSQ